MDSFDGFFINDAAGTGTPLICERVCTTTSTGWPTARRVGAVPVVRKTSGSACSRRLADAPTKASVMRSPPLVVTKAPAISVAVVPS